jgi:antitoxin (DNA-binding transcriptional repressor) of toxin-antitoxin stability system
MLYEIEVEEAGARFAEMMATIRAGYGVLIRKEGRIVARLIPESAFATLEAGGGPDDGLTAEEQEARELMDLIEADMNDSF